MDLSSGGVVAVTWQAADLGDTTTIQQTQQEAQANVGLVNERGLRRTHLRKRNHILKRLLFHAIGFNLALLLRKTHGIGKRGTLQRQGAGFNFTRPGSEIDATGT